MSYAHGISDYTIAGIQQIGIGIPDKERAWRWYRRHFNMDVAVFQEAAEAPLMTRYTGGSVQSRDAALALNMAGGGGFEIWQYTSRTPVPSAFQPAAGDLGILAARIKAPDVRAVERRLRDSRVNVIGSTVADPAGNPHLFVSDIHGFLFDVVQDCGGWFGRTGASLTGGVAGALIGVSDIDAARRLYGDILGYDQVIYDTSGRFDDLGPLPGGAAALRRVLLGHSRTRSGAFSPLLGPTRLELVQGLDHAGRRIFSGRFWGDMGFIHLCFDVAGMDALKRAAEAAGFGFTVDSGDTFDMGEAGGRFAYLEDADGTLIEFVETHKVPIVKRIGWHLDLTRRDARKPLPRWMLKAMGIGRIKDRP
ncbi:MAG: VOC family protein [Spirochaetaceae bacterium]|nr:MAG: VOC family protein [Spirochaetaceae bacterium]